ncbi:MAG: hypothetical protein M5U12_34845 [Verrucomicrobia bacterium]|nr:hypothetical protein [Verrucomicrobiota bacterium]
MYLETGRRVDVLERMASRLAPDGWLFLDPTEHLGRAVQWFGSGASGVYHRREAPNGKQLLGSLGP